MAGGQPPPPPAVTPAEAVAAPIEVARTPQRSVAGIGHGRRVVNILYLFAGISRKGDIRTYLTRFGRKAGFDVIMTETDVLRDGARRDLLKASKRDKIYSDIVSGKYDAALASPPCSTLS